MKMYERSWYHGVWNGPEEPVHPPRHTDGIGLHMGRSDKGTAKTLIHEIAHHVGYDDEPDSTSEYDISAEEVTNKCFGW